MLTLSSPCRSRSAVGPRMSGAAASGGPMMGAGSESSARSGVHGSLTTAVPSRGWTCSSFTRQASRFTETCCDAASFFDAAGKSAASPADCKQADRVTYRSCKVYDCYPPLHFDLC
ncbi:hypothetical protein E1301_Tti023504 [Triplophysa tibetana]|uniref:Uncharacterized protein n=1 Tax=Triplophysa tibetana TaxID=1572043 RepID=A0A5A9MT24_9TELE|nr:hypothetical protein E1301_Tti023504 [Triplophysa tibetana]